MRVIHLGASGAVGGHALQTLLADDRVTHVTILVRRALEVTSPKLAQHVVDVLDPETYRAHAPGHDAALCTLGVGQPSKSSRAEFLRVDRDAVLAFGKACVDAGVGHFELLGSVGADAKSATFYLKSKGELEDGLRALGFARLSLFRPSMILTPNNRYGVGQALTLALWPAVSTLLFGPMRRLRGVRVEVLGRAMARNVCTEGRGVEVLEWDAFAALAGV
jgi:uncharacterized protein YbjT (DUF2867 family)